MEVAEFISERGIDTEPDFIWWVTFTLRNRDRIIAAVISGKKGYPTSMVSNYHLHFKKSMIFTRQIVIPYGMMT